MNNKYLVELKDGGILDVNVYRLKHKDCEEFGLAESYIDIYMSNYFLQLRYSDDCDEVVPNGDDIIKWLSDNKEELKNVKQRYLQTYMMNNCPYVQYDSCRSDCNYEDLLEDYGITIKDYIKEEEKMRSVKFTEADFEDEIPF